MTPTAPASAPRYTLAELAAHIGGRAEGDGGRLLAGAAGLAEAGPGDVSFADGAQALAAAAASAAGALIVAEDLPLAGRDLIRAANPRLAFAAALALLHPERRPPAGVHACAIVAPDAAVSPEATVSAFCWVGPGARVGARSVLLPFAYVGSGATLGEDVLLHPRATVLDRVRLGDRVIVHSGAVIGSDGFGYVFDGRAHRKIPQVGTVEVGDDVEIGAGVTIDRATTGATRIGPGTKIDNLVQIGHNVQVGAHAILVAQVGIAGSSRVGEGAVLGGQVGVADHAVIGAGARIGARGGVMKTVPAGAVVSGYGPQPHAEFLRCQAVFERLPELRRRVIALEKRLAAAAGPAGGERR